VILNNLKFIIDLGGVYTIFPGIRAKGSDTEILAVTGCTYSYPISYILKPTSATPVILPSTSIISL
jgi:hypothetical protein